MIHKLKDYSGVYIQQKIIPIRIIIGDYFTQIGLDLYMLQQLNEMGLGKFDYIAPYPSMSHIKELSHETSLIQRIEEMFSPYYKKYKVEIKSISSYMSSVDANMQIADNWDDFETLCEVAYQNTKKLIDESLKKQDKETHLDKLEETVRFRTDPRYKTLLDNNRIPQCHNWHI